MITYVGWLAGHQKDIPKLRALGVTGKMIYNENCTAIECCDTTEEVMERLIKKWPKFWPNAFTAIDENGKQLPFWKQKYWSYAPPKKLSWIKKILNFFKK